MAKRKKKHQDEPVEPEIVGGLEPTEPETFRADSDREKLASGGAKRGEALQPAEEDDDFEDDDDAQMYAEGLHPDLSRVAQLRHVLNDLEETIEELENPDKDGEDD